MNPASQPPRWVTSGSSQKLNPAWVRAQANTFQRLREVIYVPYAEFLEAVLRGVAKRYASAAIVQVRAKGVISFARKAALKARKYTDEPVHQMTDLCAARVICRTREEVEAVSRFVREHFEVDEQNSLDAGSRLGIDQFGYTGFHLVVQVKGDGPVLDVKPPRILCRSIREDQEMRPKAEIQVRTVMEHAWADTFHDRLYKTPVDVPKAFRREAARLAAVLEDADDSSSDLAFRIDAFRGYHLAHSRRAQVEEERDLLLDLLGEADSPSERAAMALEVARIMASLGEFSAIVDLLDHPEYREAELPSGPGLRLLLGTGLCRSEGAPSGEQILTRVEADPEAGRTFRAIAAAELARLCRTRPGGEVQASLWYRRALHHAPSSPYYLASSLAFEAYLSRRREIPAGMRPVLERGLETCREHVRVGVNPRRAHVTMGRLHLLLGEGDAAFVAYAKAVHFCRHERAGASFGEFEEELDFLARINIGRVYPPQDEAIRRLLILSKAVRNIPEPAVEDLGIEAVRKEKTMRDPVLFLVGGAALMPVARSLTFRDALLGALADFPGTVISGGTTVGIPGMLGEIVEKLGGRKGCPFNAVAYLPEKLPFDATKDLRYHELVKTIGDGFSIAQSIQSWIDLVHQGIRPEDVRVLGYDGGRISALEYRLALALGARVCIVEQSGREAALLLKDEDWRECPNLLTLPPSCEEAMVLRAFLYPASSSDFSVQELEVLGKVVHENYVAKNASPVYPPNQLPWDVLREDYRRSNREQIAYARQTLRAAGYDIRRRTGAPDAELPDWEGFSDAEVEEMAITEHGRWVVERLASGWTYGQVKDAEKKMSPYLCAWHAVPNDIQQFDRDAVRDLREILWKAGWEVYRP